MNREILEIKTLQNRRIIRLRDVQDKTGLSRSGIYQRISEGFFPKAISLGGRSVGWSEAEIDNWIGERMNERKE